MLYSLDILLTSGQAGNRNNLAMKATHSHTVKLTEHQLYI